MIETGVGDNWETLGKCPETVEVSHTRSRNYTVQEKPVDVAGKFCFLKVAGAYPEVRKADPRPWILRIKVTTPKHGIMYVWLWAATRDANENHVPIGIFDSWYAGPSSA